MAIENDKSLKNLRVLREFRLKGVAQPVGSVIAKSDFDNAGDYMNLCAMNPPRAEQTDAKVGPAPKSGGKNAALPGAAD